MRLPDRLHRTRSTLLAACAVLLIGAAVAFPASHESTANAASTVVAVREVKVGGFPENANGQVLQLLRTTVPPGVVLPVHIHPGMQVAWIESGVLTYTVVSGGSAPITRHGMEGSPEPAEMLGPGETTELHPGDTVTEPEGVVHYGQNLGEEMVVIWSAVLFDPDLPAAVVVTPVASPLASPTGG
ncbi:MAG: cupin domain-containing protein [Thermomicrobiales bacterium]